MLFKKRRITVLLIPEEGSKTFEYKVPRYIFVLFGLGFLLSLAMLGLGAQAQLTVHRLQQKVTYLERERQLLADELGVVGQLEQELHQLQEGNSRLRTVILGPQAAQAILSTHPSQPELVRAGEYVPTIDRLRWGRVRSVPSLWPTRGPVRRPFDETFGGLVIAAPKGGLVRASAAGHIVRAHYEETLGYVVEIDHGKGVRSLYGYNTTLLIKIGQYVRKGQAIALVGSSKETGETGLYYAISEGGRFRDPLLYRLWL
jgi:murein DD-endopeptidase MepM/ murein hydrolase activator NlpD